MARNVFGPDVAQLGARKRKVTKRAARFARRPRVMFFLLSVQCHEQLCQVSIRACRVRSGERVLSVKLRCHAQLCQISIRACPLRSGERVLSVKLRCPAQLCQVRVPPGQVSGGALVPPRY